MPSRAERLQRWLFPPEVELPEPARQILRSVYPTLDLRGLRFHLGIPHFFNLFAIQGITLPGRIFPRRARIYIEPRFWNPGSVDGLGLLLHEAYHALQLQEAGPGIGLLRPFLVLYLACAAGNRFRYAGHPMEDDAYRLAGDRESLFESLFHGKEISHEGCECLATPGSGLRFWERLAASAPGRLPRLFRLPWAALWLLFWTSAVAVLALAKGLVEGAGALLVLLLRPFR
ncbi:MAG: hypothetical protein QOH06_5631 [Acidobacteriota bacterium]|jgi:hypothetical protein|nr:hypothetical protein [Acidobacteriota bacterium]